MKKNNTIKVAVDLAKEPYLILTRFAATKGVRVSDVLQHIAYLTALSIKEGRPLEHFDEINKLKNERIL